MQAEVVVSDAADGFKAAAADTGLKHQVCKSHVLRNTEDWVAAIHQRYITAPTPRELGQDKTTLAYRLRLFSLDRWNLWRCLTLYRHWRGSNGTLLDGTNNACERAIGWWIKERYRTMRGYKREQSILNVSRLIVWAGNQLTVGADLASIIA